MNKDDADEYKDRKKYFGYDTIHPRLRLVPTTSYDLNLPFI